MTPGARSLPAVSKLLPTTNEGSAPRRPATRPARVGVRSVRVAPRRGLAPPGSRPVLSGFCGFCGALSARLAPPLGCPVCPLCPPRPGPAPPGRPGYRRSGRALPVIVQTSSRDAVCANMCQACWLFRSFGDDGQRWGESGKAHPNRLWSSTHLHQKCGRADMRDACAQSPAAAVSADRCPSCVPAAG